MKTKKILAKKVILHFFIILLSLLAIVSLSNYFINLNNLNETNSINNTNSNLLEKPINEPLENIETEVSFDPPGSPDLENSVVISWEVNDLVEITNMTLNYYINTTSNKEWSSKKIDPNINSIKINDLTYDYLYTGWFLTVEFFDKLNPNIKNIDLKINDFWTLKEASNLVLKKPIVYDNNVTIGWSIENYSLSLKKLTLNHPGVGMGSTDITPSLTSDFIEDKIVINNLDYDKTYSNWNIEMIFNQHYEDQTIITPISSFKTLSQIHNLKNIEVLTDNTHVLLTWDFNNSSKTSIENSSMILNHPGVGIGSTRINNVNNVIIEGLTPNTTYSDWNFETKTKEGIELIPVQEFKTNSIPLIDIGEIETSQNSVTIHWTFNDSSLININSIILQHPNVGETNTNVTNLNEITIDDLSSNTTYSDWKLIIKLGNPSKSEIVTISIDQFTTNEVPYKNPTYIQIIIISVLVFIIILVMIISLFLVKDNKKSKLI